MSRPFLEIDGEQVKKLASMHASIEEIADFFNCSRDTIENRFRAELTAGKAEGRLALRRMQWEAAKNGNVIMMIWLGKNLLGQKDKSESIEATGNQIQLAYRLDDGGK